MNSGIFETNEFRQDSEAVLKETNNQKKSVNSDAGYSRIQWEVLTNEERRTLQSYSSSSNLSDKSSAAKTSEID